MKAKLVNLFSKVEGGIGRKQYARRIPGDKVWAAVCSKPELSKKVKQAKAEHPTAKAFAELMAATKVIMNNPALKAEWEARYAEEKRKAQKHNQPIQGRLYDYIKHELSEERKKSTVELSSY